jgi:hypothetical protein
MSVGPHSFFSDVVALLVPRAFLVLFVSAALCVLAPLRVEAQSQARQAVRGEVTNATTGEGIAGAFVVLLDTADVQRGAVLTNDAGGFIVTAPRPGRYHLRVELIGFADTMTPVFDVAVDAIVMQRIAVQPRVIVLEAIDVAVEDRCRLSRDESGETFRLWGEARKALSIAAWLEQERVPHQAVLYERSRELGGLRLIDGVRHDRRIVSGFGRSPFVAERAADLARLGYVRAGEDDSYDYFGLDAHTLLSDEFLDTHCFRLRRPGVREQGMIGLGFEPVAGHPLPDVAGTLWLDRASLALRSIEFRYTRHLVRGNVPPEAFGGRVELQRLANGAWIVRRWWIRMPQFVQSPVPERSGVQVREEGGETLFVGVPAADVRDDGARIDGVVFDSTRGVALGGARVFVDGLPHRATTAADGSFSLAGMPAGEHMVAFTHADTDRLGLVLAPVRVALEPGGAARVALGIPAAAGCPAGAQDLAEARAAAGDGARGAVAGERRAEGPAARYRAAVEATDRTTATIVGFAIDADRGEPVVGARVTARWWPGRERHQRALLDESGGTRGLIHVNAGADGRFVVCGVPPGHVVQLWSGRGATVELEVIAPVVMKRDVISR